MALCGKIALGGEGKGKGLEAVLCQHIQGTAKQANILRNHKRMDKKEWSSIEGYEKLAGKNQRHLEWMPEEEETNENF